jgi:transcriptional regulator with XRE-family HTH domain
MIIILLMRFDTSQIMKRSGKRVREKRGKLGISRERFAEVYGLHRAYIGAIERGERNVSLKNTKNYLRCWG